MMEKDKLLQKYLDGELDPEEEQKALHIFADDADMRAMLRFEQKFQGSFREDINPRSFAVPDGFSDRIMHAIKASEEQTEQRKFPAILDQLKSWTEWLWTPRPVRWRPVYAAFIIVLIMVAVSLPYHANEFTGVQTTKSLESVQPVSENADKVMLRFVFIDRQAQTVEVAGDFSDWEPISLTSQTVNGEQVWTGLIEMSRGEHQYMFIRNGKEWVTDPLAPVQQDDGFGNKNAVIYL